MTGLLIVNSYSKTASNEYRSQRLVEEFKNLGVDLIVKKSSEILSKIEDNRGLIRDSNVSFVLYFDKDKYLAALLEKAGYIVINSQKAIEICDDKMLTHIELMNKGIKMPKTIAAPLCYVEEQHFPFLDQIEKEFSYPIVVKECYGSIGKQVYLVNNRKELDDIETVLYRKNHIFQEFIESSKGFDYRVIVIGNKAIASMKRSNEYDFRSNIGLGGNGEPANLSENYIKMAEEASKILGLDYCGVDILKGPCDEPILCEVNSNAFFDGIERVTGVNVAKTLAEFVLTKL